MELGLLVFAGLLGLIPAYIAKSKGRDFGLWWLYGTMLLIVALPHAIFLKEDHAALEQRELASGQVKKCPHCAELVKWDAKVCRFCGRDVPAYSGVEPAPGVFKL